MASAGKVKELCAFILIFNNFLIKEKLNKFILKN